LLAWSCRSAACSGRSQRPPLRRYSRHLFRCSGRYAREAMSEKRNQSEGSGHGEPEEGQERRNGSPRQGEHREGESERKKMRPHLDSHRLEEGWGGRLGCERFAGIARGHGGGAGCANTSCGEKHLWWRSCQLLGGRRSCVGGEGGGGWVGRTLRKTKSWQRLNLRGCSAAATGGLRCSWRGQRRSKTRKTELHWSLPLQELQPSSPQRPHPLGESFEEVMSLWSRPQRRKSGGELSKHFDRYTNSRLLSGSQRH
jgi:hypothetical protein